MMIMINDRFHSALSGDRFDWWYFSLSPLWWQLWLAKTGSEQRGKAKAGLLTQLWFPLVREWEDSIPTRQTPIPVWAKKSFGRTKVLFCWRQEGFKRWWHCGVVSCAVSSSWFFQRQQKEWDMVTLGSCQLLRFFLLIIGKMSRGMPQREGRVEIQTSTSCLDFDFAGFHCVPIFQCSNEGVIKTDAGGLFDPRYFYNHHLSSGNAMKKHDIITISLYSD